MYFRKSFFLNQKFLLLPPRLTLGSIFFHFEMKWIPLHHTDFFYPRENFVTGRLFIRLSSKNEMFQVRVIFQTCGEILILDTLRFHEKFEQMNPCVIEKSFSIQDRCCCTVCNFQNFSTTQISREINFIILKPQKLPFLTF